MTKEPTGAAGRVAAAVGWTPPDNYEWTREVSAIPLNVVSVAALTTQIRDRLAAKRLILPDEEQFVRRCVLALLSGHLVLQGPPGTGKTTFARLLADAFNASHDTTTATAEWSTYDVVGGLRPSREGQLEPVLGSVAAAALSCAQLVRDQSSASASGSKQAKWLLVDELNRADIDKAIGPLYTVLSSVTAKHLADTPLELWFESPGRQRLWVPSRFRIIATINDVDTSFVNTLSQGLTRRFQFLFLGVTVNSEDVAREVDATLEQAQEWVDDQYGSSLMTATAGDFRAAPLDVVRTRIIELIAAARHPGGGMDWPLGTAQIFDTWRTILLGTSPKNTTPDKALRVLDETVADRIVPQAGTLDDEQLEALQTWLADGSRDMHVAAAAVHHLRNTRKSL